MKGRKSERIIAYTIFFFPRFVKDQNGCSFMLSAFTLYQFLINYPLILVDILIP